MSKRIRRPFDRPTRVVLLLTMLIAMAAPGQFNPTGKEIVLSRTIGASPVPGWENGHFFGFELWPTSGPVVYAYDGEGRKIFEAHLKIEDATWIAPYAMAASRESVFAVAGGATSASGVGTTFIALLDHSGAIQRMIRPDRFAATQLAWASDGTLWASGGRSFPRRDDPDHDVLRGYGPDGRLRFSLLPRSSFPASGRHPAEMAHLVLPFINTVT